MGRLIGVFGAAGFAREVMSLSRVQILHNEPDAELVFVDIAERTMINGIPVMKEKEFLNTNEARGFTIAIADSQIRRRLHKTALDSGATPLEIRSTSAEVLDGVTLGDGAILCGHSSITSNTQVGVGFQLNISSYLAHDCVVGDFVTFGPNVVCAGNVVVEDNVYIGGGALIRQGKSGNPITIGTGATIGMGAVVIDSVPSGATVVGNPAKILNGD